MSGRTWNNKQRLQWWLIVLSIASLLAGFSLTAGKWIYTRASTDQIVELDRKKEDKINAKEERGRLEKSISTQTKIMQNVRDNVIRLMGRQRVTPKPLPANLPDINLNISEPKDPP